MQYYGQISKGYEELYKEEQLNKMLIIKKHIKANKNTKILDVGCGTGISSDFDCTVIGIDPSIELLRQNKKIWILGNAESMPFKDNSFDYVLSVTAIHNFNGIEKSMQEIKRVGREKFVFSVLRKSNKFNYIKRLIEGNFEVEEIIEEEKDLIFFCKLESFIYRK